MSRGSRNVGIAAGRPAGLGACLLACLVTWAAGCSDDARPPAAAPQPAAATGAPPSGDAGAASAKGNAAAAANANAPVATYSFSPVGRRDPFHSYVAQIKERQDAKAQDHHRGPTELFEVQQYRLTGLVTGTTQPKAMVDDPNGDAHVLRIGTRVGKNGGRVYSINAHGMTIVEDYVDAAGKAVSVPINVRLPDDVIQDAAAKE